MQTRMVSLFTIAIFSLVFVHSVSAITITDDLSTGTFGNALQAATAVTVNNAEQIVASIAAVIGYVVAAITGHTPAPATVSAIRIAEPQRAAFSTATIVSSTDTPPGTVRTTNSPTSTAQDSEVSSAPSPAASSSSGAVPTSSNNYSAFDNPRRFGHELVGPDQIAIDYAFHITSINPSYGPPGTVVTLKGAGLADPYINVDFYCANYDTTDNSPACVASTRIYNSPISIVTNSASMLIFKIDDLTPPGQYLVSVYDIVTTPNDGGKLTSDNAVGFTVTSSTPPVSPK